MLRVSTEWLSKNITIESEIPKDFKYISNLLPPASPKTPNIFMLLRQFLKNPESPVISLKAFIGFGGNQKLPPGCAFVHANGKGDCWCRILHGLEGKQLRRYCWDQKKSHLLSGAQEERGKISLNSFLIWGVGSSCPLSQPTGWAELGHTNFGLICHLVLPWLLSLLTQSPKPFRKFLIKGNQGDRILNVTW